MSSEFSQKLKISKLEHYKFNSKRPLLLTD